MVPNSNLRGSLILLRNRCADIRSRSGGLWRRGLNRVCWLANSLARRSRVLRDLGSRTGRLNGSAHSELLADGALDVGGVPVEGVHLGLPDLRVAACVGNDGEDKDSATVTHHFMKNRDW